MRSGHEAVEVESLEIAIVSFLMVKGEQKVLWRNELERSVWKGQSGKK